MLIKPITYENFNGEKKTKNFYFNLTRTEITKMQFRSEGTLQDYLKKMVESQDNKEIYKFFEDFVLMCYGEKSADGEEFLKSDEIRNRFQCHPAYDVLMMEFVEGGDKAMSDFINAVVPKDIAEGYAKIDKVEEVNKLVGFDYVKKEES
jgi:hypothetical protein